VPVKDISSVAKHKNDGKNFSYTYNGAYVEAFEKMVDSISGVSYGVILNLNNMQCLQIPTAADGHCFW